MPVWVEFENRSIRYHQRYLELHLETISDFVTDLADVDEKTKKVFANLHPDKNDKFREFGGIIWEMAGLDYFEDLKEDGFKDLFIYVVMQIKERYIKNIFPKTDWIDDDVLRANVAYAISGLDGLLALVDPENFQSDLVFTVPPN